MFQRSRESEFETVATPRVIGFTHDLGFKNIPWRFTVTGHCCFVHPGSVIKPRH